nr:averufin oxidase a [Quercus suber]POE72083.1 averufin oxidase a [Quercus suber]
MPTYALLGATGGTGSAILRALLASPPANLTLNILVRNKAKLLTAFPSLEATSSFQIHIHEGSPSNSAVLYSALVNAEVIFCCIATNNSLPGTSVALDTAQAIIPALERHREEQGQSYRSPSLLLLRSASLNPTFSIRQGWLLHTIIMFCEHYIYADLERARELYQSAYARSAVPKLLVPIMVDPPAIHSPDVTQPTGHTLMLEGEQTPTLNYADLGVAFVELAQRKEEFAGLEVAVSATGKVTEDWPALSRYMFAGARGRILGW